MSYFRSFPKVPYLFGNEKKFFTEFTNISTYVDILDQIQDDSTAYRFYNVRDGERPDVVSQNLYNTPDYYWTFFLLNQKIREYGWPLSQKELQDKLRLEVPGEVLVFFGQDENPTTGDQRHEIIGKFPIGSNIFGSVSGAHGVVYNKNALLGQIFVRKTNDIPFQANETVVNSIGSSPDFVLTTRIVHNPAYLAFKSVEDGDGTAVDVDYRVDFRGRPDEGDVDVPGGVIGDPDNPDIYADSSPYNTVTFFDYYNSINEDQSRIKVLKPDIASQIPLLFQRSLRAT